jgi:predicted CopG family antitoxin
MHRGWKSMTEERNRRFTAHIRIDHDIYNRLDEIKQVMKLRSFTDVLKYMFNRLAELEDMEEQLKTKQKNQPKTI